MVSKLKVAALVFLATCLLVGCFGAHQSFRTSTPSVTDEYPLSRSLYHPTNIISANNYLWITTTNGIFRVSSNGDFQMVWSKTSPDYSGPQGITYGPQSRFWITVSALYPGQRWELDRIISVSPDGGSHEYNVPTYHAGVGAITIGSDKALWFIESAANKIGRMTINGSFREYSIGKLDRKHATLHPLLDLTSITKGPDSAIWFTEWFPDRIGRIDNTGRLREFQLGRGSGPGDIVAGSDHALWFTESAGYVGRLSLSGHITEFKGSEESSSLSKLTWGPDHNIWFTDPDARKVMRLTPVGQVTQFQVPGFYPGAIVAGPDGNIWFTEERAQHTGFTGVWGAVCRLTLQPYSVK